MYFVHKWNLNILSILYVHTTFINMYIYISIKLQRLCTRFVDTYQNITGDQPSDCHTVKSHTGGFKRGVS